MNLGNKILELRKKANLSQEQLAEKMKVTRQTISKWELNETTPDIRQAKELSKIFKVSLDYLTDNDIQSMVVEKLSNTEKLAGIIIKILKVLGILFLVYIVFMIVMIIVFTANRRSSPVTYDHSEVSMNCIKGSSTYDIVFDTDGNYICKGCSVEMTNDIKDIINFEDIDTSARNVENYFENINGTCE